MNKMARKYSDIRKDENDCLVSISRQLDRLRKLTLEAGDSLNLGDELTNRSYEEILKVQRKVNELGL